MKNLFLLVAAILLLTGCTTQYDTIAHKDISLKIRSLPVDLDYDSRVAIDPRELYPMEKLEPLDDSTYKPIEPIK